MDAASSPKFVERSELSKIAPFDFAGNGRYFTLTSFFFTVKGEGDSRNIVLANTAGFSVLGDLSSKDKKRATDILLKNILPFKASILKGDPVFINMDILKEMMEKDLGITCASVDPFNLCPLLQSKQWTQMLNNKKFPALRFFKETRGFQHIKCVLVDQESKISKARAVFDDFSNQTPEGVSWFQISERFGSCHFRYVTLGRSTREEYMSRKTLAAFDTMMKDIAAGKWSSIKLPLFPPFRYLNAKTRFLVRCLIDSIIEESFPIISLSPRDTFAVPLGDWIPNQLIDTFIKWADAGKKAGCVFTIRSYAFEEMVSTRDLLGSPLPTKWREFLCECGEMDGDEQMTDHLAVCKLGYYLLECGCGAVFRPNGWDTQNHSKVCLDWKKRRIVKKRGGVE